MSIRALRESGGALRTAEAGKWAATLITPGTGSSGVYSEDMLAEHASIAFKKGMKLWWGHPKEGEGPGDRDARDQWGVLDEDATYVPGEGVVGKIRLLPHWKDVVESLGDQASLSVYVMGEADDEGNITALREDVTNSVDIVSYPGRSGSGLKKKLEALGASQLPTAESSAAKEKENNMDEKILEAINSLAESLKPVVDFVTESKNAEEKAAQAKVDDQAIETAVNEALESYDEKVKAIEAADLLPSQVEEIRAEARKGADVAPLIESAKKVRDEAVTHLAESGKAGHYVSEGAAESHDFTIPRLKGSF